MPLSYSVKAVQHAVCALGGAHRMFKLQLGGPATIWQATHQRSLQQYNLAIRTVQSLMESATLNDMEAVLTCCVIFITLENLYGNYAESIRHLRAGSILLTSSFANLPKQQRVLNTFAQTLCRLGDDVWGYIREMVAPDLNCCLPTDNRTSWAGDHFDTVDAAEQALHDITKLFEAEQSVVQRKSLAYARYGYSQHTRYFMPAGGPSANNGFSFEALKERFDHWSAAFDCFQEIFHSISRPAKDMMRVKALGVDQALWNGWLRCNDWRDYRQEDLDEIIRRAESLVQLDLLKTTPVFAFDGSLILCIVMACVTTTDPDTQWRSIRLLRSFWRREGIWDSQELANILEAMVHATSSGLCSKDMLPWDVPHLAKLMKSLSLNDVCIPDGPLSLADWWIT